MKDWQREMRILRNMVTEIRRLKKTNAHQARIIRDLRRRLRSQK